ncbi:hypothetical protein MATL_G00229020 [Megalops atlanticus]|uniref:Immunoglobulin V-set domain-containing protein n=1 Tax=Megalops atlanticus TaxID=7932 RepID=A0A9D3PEV0_MEGAT|nr:hypothetical protein MATL_G00229020 [Megalops atlanticus]
MDSGCLRRMQTHHRQKYRPLEACISESKRVCFAFGLSGNMHCVCCGSVGFVSCVSHECLFHWALLTSRQTLLASETPRRLNTMHAQRDRRSVQWLLILFLAGSSASPSSFPWVTYHVGHKAILPCNWTSFMEGSWSPRSTYLTWQTPKESVFEMLGAARFEGKGYEGRVEVPGKGFEQGDCSLCLRELRFSDAGLYESFIAVGDGKMRSFIRSVQLVVRDHKYRESLREGEDLVLKLHTPEAMTVVFQGSGQPEWGVVWERGAQEGSRGVLNGDKELIITGVQMKDAGTYKVMDSQGLAVSTVHLRVTEIPKTHKPNSREHYEKQGDREAHSGVYRVSATASLILASLLLSSL